MKSKKRSLKIFFWLNIQIKNWKLKFEIEKNLWSFFAWTREKSAGTRENSAWTREKPVKSENCRRAHEKKKKKTWNVKTSKKKCTRENFVNLKKKARETAKCTKPSPLVCINIGGHSQKIAHRFTHALFAALQVVF